MFSVSVLSFLLCGFCFLFSWMTSFPPFRYLFLSSAIQCSSRRPPPASPLHLFHSAGTNTRRRTEASVQVSRPGNPSLLDKNASILQLHFAKSGWVRAARRNSCSGSDQKKGRDFFDYYLFVHPPLKLSYSLRPLSKWAASQGNAQGNSMLIGVRIYLYVFVSILKASAAAKSQTSLPPNDTILNSKICKCLHYPTVHVDPSPLCYNLF